MSFVFGANFARDVSSVSRLRDKKRSQRCGMSCAFNMVSCGMSVNVSGLRHEHWCRTDVGCLEVFSSDSCGMSRWSQIRGMSAFFRLCMGS
jgi:hypothetical protein